ncbi:MAG: hypothetical protein V1773_00960 [bacterium]
MKLRLILVFVLFYAVGCSTFKELVPDPELSPIEKGYIQLKDDDENFELKKGDKYFIKFPKAIEKNFYVILSTSGKPSITSYFTDFFDDGKGDIKKLTDESNGIDSLLVYRIGQDKEFYYWVIEDVKNDILLSMNYRYSPIWRFKFEVKYADYKQILNENITNRSIYKAISINYNFDNFDFDKELSTLNRRKENIEKMNRELDELKNIFPDNIANTGDAAYKNYIDLRGNVDDELEFLKNYNLVLTCFKSVDESKNNFGTFLDANEKMLEMLTYPNRFTAGVTEKAKKEFAQKLAGAYNYYYSILQKKNDIKPFNFNPGISNVEKLYKLCSKVVPADFTDIADYIDKFESEAKKMEVYYHKEQEMKAAFKDTPLWPNNSFYPKVLDIIREMKSIVPSVESAEIERFSSLNCTDLINKAVTNAKRNTIRLELGFQVAEVLVPRLNNLKRDEMYKDMLGILNENRELDYLLNQYTELDNLYIEQQKGIIRNNMKKYGFGLAEQTLRGLFNEKGFVSNKNIEHKKNQVVEQCEGELYESVKRLSKVSVDSFVARNQMTITNIKALYEDSAFVPVHQLSFSSKGSGDLENKRAQIQSYLDNMKYYQLPENAVRNIYQDFVKNINNRGVEKARAIVEHGRYYKGTDKTINTIIDECDINVPKWITKPMDYREVYVLPVTTNKSGMNEYMFKMRLQIPSDAQFPVFDINIKLPDEVAKNSNNQQWFEKITINNNLIKNEGRVKITSPTSSNGYETQISPVQMDKDGKNVLEVRFKYPGFKVFKVSAMAQKPIIKKN